jgi:hypothetical protein
MGYVLPRRENESVQVGLAVRDTRGQRRYISSSLKGRRTSGTPGPHESPVTTGGGVLFEGAVGA